MRKDVKVGDGSDKRECAGEGGVCGIVMRVGVLVCTGEDDGVMMVWGVQWSSSLAVAGRKTELVGIVVVEDSNWRKGVMGDTGDCVRGESVEAEAQKWDTLTAMVVAELEVLCQQ